MKHTLFILLYLCVCIGANAQSKEQLLLSGWRFHKGAAEGAEAQKYDDSKWQKVIIPHDWAISGPFDKEIDKQTVAIVQNGEKEATEKTGRSGSLPWIGEGWYRTEIEIPEGYSHAELVFDGAMAEPRVYVNGTEVGYWAFGYNTFNLNITHALARDRSAVGNLIPGKASIAVHLQNVEESSRWYPGAGLYRPVRLLLGREAGIKTFGTFARTTRVDNVSDDARKAMSALFTVNTEVRGTKVIKSGDMKVVLSLKSADGFEVARSEAKVNDAYETAQVLNVKNAALWSPEHPVLYTLITELQHAPKGGEVRTLDVQRTQVGIRSIEYGQDGFRLNGQQRKFKGVCLHHDLGPFGAAFNKAAFRRQIRLLKDIGCDAIRTSHNMPAPWQMDICDEMGMLVMAESCDMWLYPKCKNGYARFFEEWWERDFTNLVRVHRNHPSIVMWSIGNEIPEQGNAKGLTYTRKIQSLIHSLDPTRPCTQGLDRGEASIWSGVFQETDIPGFNYRVHLYDKGHVNSPKGILLGSETASTVSSRGVYKFPVVETKGKSYDDGQVSSYDLDFCSWSNLPDDDWMWQDKAPWVMGEFVWTGFDYLGEPTPYDTYWPSRSSYFGIYDLAGLPKDRAWLYRTHWAPEKETLHLLPHWTWTGREGEVTPVFCYTNYPEAELFINGKSQGRLSRQDLSLDEYKSKNPKVNRLDRYRLRWMDTKYEPGELKVVAYDANGNVAAEKVVRTAGKPHHIELVCDRSALTATPMIDGMAQDCPDLCFVTVRVVDKDGNLCPDADHQLSFSVKGQSAKFNSCCNGDATSLEVFTNPTMKAFHGELVVVVEATDKAGTATLTVTAQGLKAGKATITTSQPHNLTTSQPQNLTTSQPQNPTTLKDAYNDYFKIGVAVNQRNVTDSLQQSLVCREFNSVTAENDFKPQPTEPREGEFNWDRADRIADFCRANGIKMRGHCLMWHNQVGEWMFYDENHNLVSKEVLFARMKSHITTIMKRYADVVYAWDVVNEAITDNPNAPHPYRESLFYKIAGDEFIRKAFIYAREADPKALLFYNDYNEVVPHKRDRIVAMIREMKAAGVPIDGFGMQAHYNVFWPNEKDIEDAIKAYAEVVDHIHVTELDLRTNTEHGGGLQFSQGEGGISPELQKRQDEQYDMIFRVLRRNHEKIDCVTFWNLGDRDSWLGKENYPLIFDSNYQPKSSYDKVVRVSQ